MEDQKVKKSLKQKLFHEFTEYLINVIYMTIFFGVVILYRRLVLAEHGIFLNDYFMGLIKALVIAKVVMIGAFLRISRKYENKPLIIPTIYKALLFTIWVMLFDLIEVFVGGFIHNPVLADVVNELNERVSAVWFGGALVIFVSFMPFFAMKEVSRVIGSKKFRGMFLKRKEPLEFEERNEQR